MLTIAIFDHDTGAELGDLVKNFPPELDGFSIFRQTRRKDEKSVPDHLKDHDIVIGHFLSDANWENLVRKSKGGQKLRIRTSTCGRSGEKHTVTALGVVVLNLCPKHDDLTPADWEGIIVALVKNGVAKGIAEGTVPPALAKYFADRQHDVLPSLAVLCQGYLIAHISPKDTPDGGGVWYGGSSAVKDAVQKMGWPDPSGEDRQLLIEQGKMAASNRAEPRELVRNPAGEYWKPLAGLVDLEGQISREWDSEAVSEDVKWLLTRIAENESIDAPERVAQVYLDLREKLS